MSKPLLTPDDFVRRWMRRTKIPGASLAVAERGRPTLTRAYGYRDREARLPATPRTIYGVASITKSFTALAILKLEEEGKLSVRDRVVRHLPEFGTPDPRATGRITIHHFLTHTSGLPPLTSQYYTRARALAHDAAFDTRIAHRMGFDPTHPPIDTYAQLMDFLRTTRYRLLGPPGRYFSYSNEGFALLGAVIDRVSGRTHESYVEEQILRPAGMSSTTYDSGVVLRQPEVTTLYSPRATGKRHGLAPSRYWADSPCVRASMGLRSNVEDLARYAQIFFSDGKVDGERILTARSIRKMTTPHVELARGSYYGCYGYGISVQPDYYGSPLLLHGGAGQGISSFFAVAPRRHLGGAVLANVGWTRVDLALMAEINLRLGLPLDAQWGRVPSPVETNQSLSQYKGWYGCGSGLWFEVKELRNALWLDFHGTQGEERGMRLRPAGQDRFVFRSDGRDDQVLFNRDARGRIWAISAFALMIRRRAPKDIDRARKGTLVW